MDAKDAFVTVPQRDLALGRVPDWANQVGLWPCYIFLEIVEVRKAALHTSKKTLAGLVSFLLKAWRLCINKRRSICISQSMLTIH